MIDSIIPFLFAHVALVIGLRYTHPYSIPRYLLQIIIYVCCFVSVRSTFSLNLPAQAGGQYIWGMMMSSSHWMLLAGVSSATHAPPGKELKWAIEMLFSARWGVSKKMLPVFRRKDRSYVPPRAKFLMARTWDCIWCGALIVLFRKYQLYIYDSDFTSVPDGFLYRLNDVTPVEWVIRVYLTLLGNGMTYLALRCGHSLISIIAVAAGDAPAKYPPLFGSIKDAYRVRRYYVYFWHHLVRKPFTTHASFIVNDIFRVPRQTELSRYLVLAMSFAISALMHIFVAPNISLRCQAWPQFRFYLSIAGAIVLEDLVTLGYKRLVHKRVGNVTSDSNVESMVDSAKASSSDAKPALDNELKMRLKADETADRMLNGKSFEKAHGTKDFEQEASQPVFLEKPIESPHIAFRAIGYIWVFAFEVWSTSKLLYRIRQCVIAG